MAISTQIVMDTRYKTIAKYLCSASANALVELIDVSDLIGWQVGTGANVPGGILNLAKIYWTTASATTPISIFYADGSSGVLAFIACGSSGTYGYSPGQPAINPVRAGSLPWAPSGSVGAITGDMAVTSASATFTLVIEYHKISPVVGQQLGWNGANP